jgi:hypothetical protein
MPTRAEVQQAFRARDEFQNRDMGQIMDYLEQEAGSSSGTRATVVDSQVRTQDAVTQRDLEAIYNYAAELGTPVSTLEAFLEAVAVRRDIVSRALVDHILDLIDGTVFPADPLTAKYWFDFDDLSTLFQDVAFLTPVTTDGQDIRSMTNKGTEAGQDLTEGAAAGGTITTTTWAD